MKDDLLPVLIDTSVWVELLRSSRHGLLPHLQTLIDAGRARLCEPILGELMMGATAAQDSRAVEDLAGAIPLLEDPPRPWLAAGELGRRLREKGVTVGLVDAYLAALAIARECRILSLDRHFALIAKHSDLKLDPAALAH